MVPFLTNALVMLIVALSFTACLVGLEQQIWAAANLQVSIAIFLLATPRVWSIVDRCHIEERSMDYQYLYMSCLDENNWSISTFFRAWFQGW